MTKRASRSFSLAIFFILLTSTFVFVVSRPVYAHETRGQSLIRQNLIQLSAEAGIDGRFREGRWTPLLIRVSNSGPGMTGELRVASGGTIQLTNGGYSTPIDLPNQSSKQVFLYIALESFTQQVQVDLVQADGALLTSTVASLSRISQNDLLVGVITESPAGSLDFSGVRTNGAAFQSSLSLENIPPLGQGLEALDVLVFDDVDTGRLSLDRRRAVESWVLAGGHLIVTGGPNWQKTRAGFDTLMPTDAGSTVTLNSLSQIAAFAGYGNDAPSAVNVIAAQGLTRPGATVILEQDGIPLIVRRSAGLGTVHYMTLDPTLEPFKSWSYTPTIWTNLFASITPKPGWSGGVVQSNEAIRAINYTRGLRLPDVVQLAGFLLVYIILIGPLNYLILRGLHRPELAWVTIPAIILVTSVAAYFIGSNLRGTLPTISRMSIVQQWPGKDDARLDGIAGVLAPRRSIYNVEGAEGVVLRALGGDNAVNIKIEEGARYAANNIPVDAGLSANFLTSALIPPLALRGKATVTIIDNETVRVVGEVRNESGTTLTDTIVFCINTPQTIGTLEPNETRPFEFTAKLSELSYPSIVGGVNGLAQLYGRTYSSYRYARELTLSDLLVSGARRRDGETTAEQNEQRRRSLFAASIANDVERGFGRGFEVYFVGWTNTSPIQVDLRGANANIEDLTVYLIGLDTVIDGRGQSVTLQPGQTLWTPLTRSTIRELTPYNLYVIGGTSAAFRFAPHPAFQLVAVDGFTLTARLDNNSGNGILALWDWKAGAWIDLPTPTRSEQEYQFRTNDEIARFVGLEGAIRVQVRAPSSATGYDSIQIQYTGRLAG